MADPITTTTSPIVGDHVHACGNSNYSNDGYGRAGDHLAFESMTTPKDAIQAISAVERLVEAKHTAVSGLVTDSSFRTLEQFNLTSVQAEKNAAAITLQNEKLAAAASLQAEKIAAAHILAAGECCCEMKELIREQNSRTQDLINSLEKDRTARELQDAKVEISNLNQDVRFRALLAEFKK